MNLVWHDSYFLFFFVRLWVLHMFGVNLRLRKAFFLSMISISTGILLFGSDTRTVRLGTPTTNKKVRNTYRVFTENAEYSAEYSVYRERLVHRTTANVYGERRVFC